MERLGKVELIGITASVRHRLDGQGGGAQQLAALVSLVRMMNSWGEQPTASLNRRLK